MVHKDVVVQDQGSASEPSTVEPKPLTPTELKRRNTARVKDILKLVPRHLLHQAASLCKAGKEHRQYAIENVAVYPTELFATNRQVACAIPIPTPLPTKPEYNQPLLLNGEELWKSRKKLEAVMRVREAAYIHKPHAIFPPEHYEPTVIFNLELLLQLLRTLKALGAENVVLTSTQPPADAMNSAVATRMQQLTCPWRIDGYNENVKLRKNTRVAEGVIMPRSGSGVWTKERGFH